MLIVSETSSLYKDKVLFLIFLSKDSVIFVCDELWESKEKLKDLWYSNRVELTGRTNDTGW